MLEMKERLFTRRKLNLASKQYYRPFHRLILIAAVIVTSVLTGSLLIGDSVRATLERKAHERLGDTETVIVASGPMMNSDFLSNPLFRGEGRGVLLSQGFVPNNGRMIPVMVWGVDDMDIPRGEVVMNERLSDELSATNVTDIVLRLPANGLVPSGSLFVTDVYTTSLRLTFRRTLDRKEGGNLLLANQQTTPLNLFINRMDLEEALEVPDKINLILHPRLLPIDSIRSEWSPQTMGLHYSELPEREETSIHSDRVFLSKPLVDLALRSESNANRLFSYLVNNLSLKSDISGDSLTQIPYSFATALDRYNGTTLRSNEILLSDYSAQRMKARVGDTVTVTFFVSEAMKVLKEETLDLVVGGIIPLATLQRDTALSAQFPGLSDVESCTDWNSDLPINMKRITKEDERYWDLYRTTPKALIAYSAVDSLWSNIYGSATSVRIPTQSAEEVERTIEQQATFDMFGLQVVYPRDAAFSAARDGVDFSSLFLSLGFFIILAALLLMALPIKEMMLRRKKEFELLQSVGFTNACIRRLLFRESIPTLLLGVVLGVVGGVVYTQLILWLLGSLWQGATHADNLTLSFSPQALVLGGGISLVVSVAVQWFSLRSPEKIKHSKPNVLRISNKKSEFTFPTLIRQTILFDKTGAVTSFITLLLGVMVVFMVGLHRSDYSTAGKHTVATGSFTHWCETSVPVYHSLSTFEGREKLGLKALEASTSIVQLLRHQADDASCLNLNKPQHPSIIGIDYDVLYNNPFVLHPATDEMEVKEAISLAIRRDSTYFPVVVDQTVLQWSLFKQVGDTIHYSISEDKKVVIQIVASLSNSIFQGNMLMPIDFFRKLFPETTGSTLFLLKTPAEHSAETVRLLETSLYNYGITVQPTVERLAAFNSVTDTYLSIFMTLGGLGLLIGIIAFVVVVRKNLVMRQAEITLYRSLGYSDQRISSLLYRQNIIIPLSAILSGILLSILSLGAGITNVDSGLWGLAVGLGLIFVVSLIYYIKEEIRKSLNN